MVRRSFALGIVLTGLGVGVYVGGSGSSLTALIPAAIGLPIAVLALLSLRSDRPAGWHIAAASLAFVGFVGALPGLLRVGQLLQGAELARPTAVAVQSVMAVLCAVFLAFAGRASLKSREAFRPDSQVSDLRRDAPPDAA